MKSVATIMASFLASAYSSADPVDFPPIESIDDLTVMNIAAYLCIVLD